MHACWCTCMMSMRVGTDEMEGKKVRRRCRCKRVELGCADCCRDFRVNRLSASYKSDGPSVCMISRSSRLKALLPLLRITRAFPIFDWAERKAVLVIVVESMLHVR